jgi:protein-S-isoprenylcysteine O-methyltransferase Ste14
VVVLALSIASITYGALLGTYILAGRWPQAAGQDAIRAVVVTVLVMLVVVFAMQLAGISVLAWIAPFGKLAWPWYVPLGTAVAVGVGVGSSMMRSRS